MNTKIETLKKELSNLRDNLLQNWDTREEKIKQIRSIEEQIKKEQKNVFLNNFNKEHQKKRELASIIFNIEKINIEDVTSERKVNKQKIKKYPKYFNLEYCYLEIYQNLVYSVSYKGEKFKLYYYHEGKLKEIETFENFLKVNYITPKEITLKEYNKILNDIKKAESRVKTEIEKYNNFKKDFYFLNTANLIRQKDETIYFLTERNF